MAETEKLSDTSARKEKFGITRLKSLRESVVEAVPERVPFATLKFKAKTSGFVMPEIVRLPVEVAFHEPSLSLAGAEVDVGTKVMNSFAAWSDFKINLPIAPSRCALSV